MSKKIFGTALKVVGIVALVAATAVSFGLGGAIGGAVSALGGTSMVLAAGSVALSVGGGLLAAAKAAKAAASARAEQIHASVNPQATANWVFGETATAVQIIYGEVFGSKKDKGVQVYAGPAHEIEYYGELHINDELVTFSGASATGAWSGALKRYVNLGSENQAALSISGSAYPSSARGRGFAHFALEWDLSHDKLKDGIPNRITQVVKGCKCYDPRLDSTVGGSGSHRADNQATWAYSANWALICLHYILGWKNNNKLVYGRGANPEDIDYASFISSANACDQIFDGKPRYHIGGIERLDGEHARVIASLEATIGGKISKQGGMYHCWAPHDDLVPLDAITENDLLRDVGINYQDARSIENIFNIAGGQYINPDILYQPDSIPQVREEAAIADHGRERVMNYDTTFLQSAVQAQRVLRQQIRRSIYGRVFQLGVGPKYFRRKVFDVITLNIRETNFENLLVRITNKQTSANGQIIFTLEEENSVIYDMTAPLLSKAQRNIPPTFDAATVIPVTGLDATPITMTGTSSTASDALKVTYDDAGPLIARTEIEYQIQNTAVWQPAASQIIDAGAAIISPVESGTVYYVRVRHVTIFNVTSPWVTDFTTAGENQEGGKGDKGDTGNTGAVGNTGSKGDAGDKGDEGRGGLLNKGTDDLKNWSRVHNAYVPLRTTTIVNDGGVKAIRSSGVDGRDIFSREYIKIDPTKNYRVRCKIRSTGANKKNYSFVAAYDINKLKISIGSKTGWFGGGEHFYYYHYYSASTPTTWTENEVLFGPAFEAKLPAGTEYIKLGWLTNYQGYGTGDTLIKDLELIEVDPRAFLALRKNGGILSQKILGANQSAGARSATNIYPASSTSNSITIAPFSAQFDFGKIYYNGGTITGLSPSTKYHIYCDDDKMIGGSVIWKATKNIQEACNRSGRLKLLTFATRPLGGTTPVLRGDFDSECVAINQYIELGFAENASKGGDILILDEDGSGYFKGQIEQISFSAAPCVKLVTTTGIKLICSETTPVTLRDGIKTKFAPFMAGIDIAVLDNGIFRWEEVISVTNVGIKPVAHISVGGRSYAAGSDKDRLIFTHNMEKP